MKKAILLLAVLAVAMSACRNRSMTVTETTTDSTTVVTWNEFTKIAPEQIEGNFIKDLGENWMLVTAGTLASYNTMTASWGGIGIVWQRPVTFITIRNTRYTYTFLQANDIYTLTFFGGAEKEAMGILGSRSGRDGDKVALTDLTPVETPLGSVSFRQATMVIECRKIFENALDPKSIFVDEIAADYMKNDERHILFFGEIVNVWVKK